MPFLNQWPRSTSVLSASFPARVPSCIKTSIGRHRSRYRLGRLNLLSGRRRESTWIITSSLAAITTVRRINWWARRSRREARKGRWRSSIKVSGLPVTHAAADRIAPARTLSTVRSRTSSIWSGRPRASSNGPARLVPSQHGWWRASWPVSRIRRWGIARHWG